MAAQSSSSLFVFCTGDAKSEDTANKEAGEEKPEEDNDYHRSDEQVSTLSFTAIYASYFLSPGPLKMSAFSYLVQGLVCLNSRHKSHPHGGHEYSF